MTEIELCRQFVQAFGLNPYQEVAIVVDNVRRIADLVTVEESEVCVYEAKLHLNQELVNQAKRWRAYFHRVSIVVPESAVTPSTIRLVSLLERYGIGVINLGNKPARYLARPRFNRNARIEVVIESLTGRQKVGSPPAGTRSGRRVVADGCDQAREMIAAHPGITGRELKLDLGWSKDEYRDFNLRVHKGRIDGVVAEGHPARY